MKEKRPHLGRGLESLLGPITTQADNIESQLSNLSSPPFPPDKGLHDATTDIPIDRIKANPFQPRSVWNDEELMSLADSIRVNGILQPILVRKTGDQYEIIAGERRFRASKLAGLTRIKVIVRQATDQEMLELALVENIHRSDLNPIERATAYQNYIISFSMTHAEAAERLGQDRSVVTNYIRLLDLPQEVKQMLIDNQITMGHARAILALPSDELRRKLANRAHAGRLSVREIERLVKKIIDGNNKIYPTEDNTKAPHIIDLERRLQDVLGTKVQIRSGKRSNKGRIIIDFYSIDEFDRITSKIGLVNAD